MDGIIIKIYKYSDNNELVFDKDYMFDLNKSILQVKSDILKESFENKFNSLDLENITERVYKDFGKLFFDKGLIPQIFEKYKLVEITNGDRTFSFVAKPKNIEIEVKKITETGFLKKIIKNNNKNSGQLFVYEDDFPPLGK